MIKRNVSLVIGTILLSSSLFIGCSKEVKATYNDFVNKAVISKLSTNDDKEINQKYINSIILHLDNIGIEWENYKAAIINHGSLDSKLTCIQNIQGQWRVIQSIKEKKTNKTTYIKELDKQLEEFRHLHDEAIDHFLNYYSKSDIEYLKKGFDSFNKATYLYNTKTIPFMGITEY